MGNNVDLKRTSDKGYIILAVDDDYKKYSRSLTASIRNCRVIHVPDYRKASEFFFHNNIDLLLLDNRDDDSCIEMVRFAKSVKPEVPVLVLTQKGSEDFAVKVFRSGARDYFRKPVVPDEFRACVKSSLGMRELFPRRKDDSRDYFHLALKYIHEYYNTHITLSQAARESGMSLSSFAKKFKSQMGTTFIAYVNKLRVESAAEMLKGDRLTMNEISFSCGFNNQFHFSRMFRKIMNTSPTFYRKSFMEHGQKNSGCLSANKACHINL